MTAQKSLLLRHKNFAPQEICELAPVAVSVSVFAYIADADVTTGADATSAPAEAATALLLILFIYLFILFINNRYSKISKYYYNGVTMLIGTGRSKCA